MPGKDEYFAKYIAQRLDDVVIAHIEARQLVAPWGAAPVTVASAAGAFNWGAYSNDIIADGAVAHDFMLHWAVLADADANGHYELEFYYGATDIWCARCAFTRTAPFTSSVMVTLKSQTLPANSRIRARMRHSVGVASALVKIYYHHHN